MKKIMNLVNDDMLLSLVFMFSTGYFFSLAMIAANSRQYAECIISAIFSIISFASGYIFYKAKAE